MERDIVRQQFLLRRPAREATADDVEVARDLADTLVANAYRCIGMAANMIGFSVAIIAVTDTDGTPLVMLNPKIEKATGPYECEEGCLSLDGVRPCKRFRKVWVSWQDMGMAPHRRAFTGTVAEAIQHECDHLAGIII